MCSMLYYELYVARSIKDREKMNNHGILSRKVVNDTY